MKDPLILYGGGTKKKKNETYKGGSFAVKGRVSERDKVRII